MKLALSIVLTILTAAGAASASERSSIEELVAAMRGRMLSDAELGVRLIDCPPLGFQESYPTELVSRFHVPRQWLINGPYQWVSVQYPTGTCVHLHREGSSDNGLASAEARALLSAAKLDLPDPAHAMEQRAFNCHVRRGGDYGGYIPPYEEGAVGGHRYRIFYAGLASDLSRLDAAQRRFGKEQKRRLEHLPPTGEHSTQSAYELDIRFGTATRTRDLAMLSAYMENSGPPRAAVSWMLHLPTGRLITFDDLFVDPDAVRERIVRKYLDYLPEYKANSIPQVPIEEMSEDIGPITRVAMAYERTRQYFNTARELLTPPPRLRDVGVGQSDGHLPSFGGYFDVVAPPWFDLPLWGATAEDLEGAFKPEYRSVLVQEACPPMPDGW
jgi:hypothetical protein